MNRMKFVIGSALAALSVPALAAPPQVRTDAGPVEGFDQKGVSTYLGIPYAAPPVGANRWRAPQPVAKWSAVRKAQAFGSACYQNDGPAARNIPPYTPEYLNAASISEDCLFVNVWAPANKSAKKLPVFFWIHGGGFAIGGGDVPIYDGRNLAARDIVVVSVNYRLGHFGFFSHPALSAEAGSSGNYALMDMIAGLQWVKRNIAAFGGDPSRVTIAGQSAGSAAVHDLILSPQAKGLFHQAIAQSGSGMGVRIGARQEAEQSGLQAAEKKGWKTLADLRNASAADIQTGLVGSLRAPIADGVVLPTDANDALEQGRYNDTPMMTGYTADEASARPGYFPVDAADYSKRVGERYGAFGDQVLSQYPQDRFLPSSLALGTDRTLSSMLFWAEGRRKTTRYPIYGYLFSHIEPGPDSAKYRAFHSSELPYLFGTLGKTPERGFTAVDTKVSDTIQTYWVNFVRTGDPNGASLPAWPKLDQQQVILEFGETAKARPAMSPAKLELFRSYVKSGGRLGLF